MHRLGSKAHHAGKIRLLGRICDNLESKIIGFLPHYNILGVQQRLIIIIILNLLKVPYPSF